MYISQGLAIVWLTTWLCVTVTVWQMCGGKPHASKIWACDKNIGKKKSKMSELRKEALKSKYGGLPPAPKRPGKSYG